MLEWYWCVLLAWLNFAAGAWFYRLTTNRKPLYEDEPEKAKATPAVRGGLELSRKFDKLTPHQQQQCFQYLMGGFSTAGYGFNSGAYPHEASGRWAMDETAEAIRYGAEQ